MIVGVDPGKDGALCALAEERFPSYLAVLPMPLIHGAKRDAYDLAKILDWLSGADHVFVEKLQPMPLKKGGTIANYNRGYCTALFETACTALKRPLTLVRPQEWQREMFAGSPGDDTKQRSILVAMRLFPGFDLRRTERCCGPHDGIADALLIAEWGRRKLTRGNHAL